MTRLLIGLVTQRFFYDPYEEARINRMDKIFESVEDARAREEMGKIRRRFHILIRNQLIAVGWWTHFPGQRYPELNFWQDDAYTYIFADGPELNSESQPKFPVKGAASYRGTAGGAFGYEYGENWGDAKGKFSIDEYEAAVTLTADFGESTIGGCIGCEGDIVVKSQHLQSMVDKIEGEDIIDRRIDPKDYEIHFAPTKFDQGGGFHSEEGVSVKHPERIGQTIQGSWNGVLSNRSDSAGNPRLVVGGNKILFAEEDGTLA